MVALIAGFILVGEQTARLCVTIGCMKCIAALALVLLTGCAREESPIVVEPISTKPSPKPAAKVVAAKPTPTATFMPVTNSGLPTGPGTVGVDPMAGNRVVAGASSSGEISVSGNNRGSGLASSRPPRERKIASWSGEGIKNTEVFHVSSNNARIVWGAGPSNDGIAGLAQAYLYKANGELADLAMNEMVQSDKTGDTRITAPGDYYLKINCANVFYSISVYETR